MFTFNNLTYANADNVSGHPLDRVCREVEQLIKQWPDRLTMASTGGPFQVRMNAIKKAGSPIPENSKQPGVMGIEYSLSCPQGGDGTEGNIVSQNAALTAKIIDWIMEVGSPDIPKLFKLTAAVTSIVPILRAIRQVLNKYPEEKSWHYTRKLLPHISIQASCCACLGGRRCHRHERRWRHAHFLFDTGECRSRRDRNLRQWRTHDLQSRHGFPGSWRQNGPVLHDCDQVRIRHHSRHSSWVPRS